MPTKPVPSRPRVLGSGTAGTLPEVTKPVVEPTQVPPLKLKQICRPSPVMLVEPFTVKLREVRNV